MPIPRMRSIFTAHQRTLIFNDLKTAGISRRQRCGVKVEFRMSDTPKIPDTRIGWTARIRGVWHDGAAATVHDAIAEIERRYTS
jgi:hypothetical protein